MLFMPENQWEATFSSSRGRPIKAAPARHAPLRGRWLPSPQGNKQTLLDTSALKSRGWYYWHLGSMILHLAKLPVHCRNPASLSSVLQMPLPPPSAVTVTMPPPISKTAPDALHGMRTVGTCARGGPPTFTAFLSPPLTQAQTEEPET